MKKIYFSVITILLTVNHFGFTKEIPCSDSVKKLCGNSATPSKCLKEKESSLPMKCRIEMKKNKELLSKMSPSCMKAINTSCKLDLNALQKNQTAYMKIYQKCIEKNQDKIKLACKSEQKYIKETSSKRKVK